MQILMNKHKIAPKIYEHFIIEEYNGIQFGVIVMKKLDDVLSHYNNDIDTLIVQEKISKMHSLGYYHGDLLPCNIAVNIYNGQITKCRIIDWFFSGKLTENNLKNIDKDWRLYRHAFRN